MRTTLRIDDDVLAAARELAVAKRISVGAALSQMARSAMSPAADGGYRNGIKLLPVGPHARTSTLEDVNRLRDELP